MRGGFLTIAALAALASPALGDVVETRRGLDAYSVPRAEARKSRGRVLRGARFEIRERARGAGCKRDWIRIGPRAWICSTYTAPTDQPAGGQVWPEVEGNRDLPHTYVVTRDAVAYRTLADAAAQRDPVDLPGQGGFRYRGSKRHQGATYVRTDHGWIPAGQAQVVKSVPFHGSRLDAGDFGKRLAFVGAKPARIYDASGAATRARLPRQTYLGEVATAREIDGKMLVDAGDGRFLRPRDLALVTWPAPAAVAADERWIDVDMTQQVLVAYKGKTPVYATLVSTARTATPVGEFRIEKKRPYSRMRSKPHYRTKWDTHAPWVISIKGRIAIHAVYWHQEFGKARSQGCVNVAPRDAQFLWDWTEPALPPGWVRIEADAADRPTLVRIRRSR